MGGTVRFAKLIEAAGSPKIYLPLSDPSSDKAFQNAKRQQRILTVKQNPTGTRKDYGVVGARREKHVSYLIFPKSLARFEKKRVVGIDYRELEASPLETSSAAPSPKRSTPAPPKTKSKPKPPQPRKFHARVKAQAVIEIEMDVSALSATEARRKAVEKARRQARFTDSSIIVRVMSLARAGQKEPAAAPRG